LEIGGDDAEAHKERGVDRAEAASSAVQGSSRQLSMSRVPP
jgi:hypothetical protein